MSIPLLPGERTIARRMKFALVNACTLASLVLGMLAIFLAMQGDVRIAALCLIACVGFDGLDGALARRLGVASPFGAQMDSLADMCSFGLAAPVVVYASLAGSVPTAAAAVACALVAAAPRSGSPGSTSRRRTAGSSAACRPPWRRRCSPWRC